MIDQSGSYEFNKKIYKDGMRARRKGRTLHSNPWPGNTNAYRSWNAGWTDQAENESSEREHQEPPDQSENPDVERLYGD